MTERLRLAELVAALSLATDLGPADAQAIEGLWARGSTAQLPLEQ